MVLAYDILYSFVQRYLTTLKYRTIASLLKEQYKHLYMRVENFIEKIVSVSL